MTVTARFSGGPAHGATYTLRDDEPPETVEFLAAIYPADWSLYEETPIDPPAALVHTYARVGRTIRRPVVYRWTGPVKENPDA